MALIAGLENRREALSQVVLRLVDERGLEGVTVRGRGSGWRLDRHRPALLPD